MDFTLVSTAFEIREIVRTFKVSFFKHPFEMGGRCLLCRALQRTQTLASRRSQSESALATNSTSTALANNGEDNIDN